VTTKTTIFYDVTPCSLVKCNVVSEEHTTCLLALLSAFLQATCLAYSSTLKMEAVCSSEQSVNLYPTT
jgi:hypothetical protein